MYQILSYPIATLCLILRYLIALYTILSDNRSLCIRYRAFFNTELPTEQSTHSTVLTNYTTWSWLKEDLAPWVRNTACLARVKFHSRKLLPETKKPAFETCFCRDHLLVGGVHKLLQLVALLLSVQLSPSCPVLTVVLFISVKHGGSFK